MTQQQEKEYNRICKLAPLGWEFSIKGTKSIYTVVGHMPFQGTFLITLKEYGCEKVNTVGENYLNFCFEKSETPPQSWKSRTPQNNVCI